MSMEMYASLIKKDKNRLDNPKMARIPEMVEFINALMLADRRVTIEDISE